MFAGISFLTVTGIMWVLMGAVISRAAQKQLNISFIQGFSGLLIAFLILPAAFTGKLPVWQVGLTIFIAGFFNYYIFLLVNKAMKIGPNGLIWAMFQSAFVIPFIMGIALFSVPCSVIRLIGLLLLVCSTVLMGFSGREKPRERSGNRSNKWLYYTVIGFFLTGLDQAGNNLPSYFIKEEAFDFCGLIARSGFCGAGFAAAWMSHILFNKENRIARNCMLDTVLMTGSIIGATICLFYGLDKLASIGAGAIGYPLATGVTIAAFQLYTAIVLKERLSWLGIFSILLCLTGIAMITQ